MKLTLNATSMSVLCLAALACQPQASGQEPASRVTTTRLDAPVSQHVQPSDDTPLGHSASRLAELTDLDRMILADEHTSADLPRLLDAYAERESRESLTVINRACLAILCAELEDFVAADSHARVLEQQLASNERAPLDTLTRAIVLAALETVYVRTVDAVGQRRSQRKDFLDSIEELSDGDLRECTVLKGVRTTMLYQRALLTGTSLTSVDKDAALSSIRVAVEQGSRGEAYAVADLLYQLDQRACMSALDRIVERFPDMDKAYLKRELVLANLGATVDERRANLEAYPTGVTSSPRLAAAYASLCALVHRTDDALKYADAALQQIPDYAAALYARGKAHMFANRHLVATEDFGTVLEKNPRHDGAWNDLGICYAVLGHHQQALQCFDKAIAGTLGSAGAVMAERRGNRAKILLSLDRLDESRAEIMRARELDATSSNLALIQEEVLQALRSR